MNSGIRDIYGIARYGYECVTNLSCKLKIPGIVDIRKYVCQKAVWDRRSYFKSNIADVPETVSYNSLEFGTFAIVSNLNF